MQGLCSWTARDAAASVSWLHSTHPELDSRCRAKGGWLVCGACAARSSPGEPLTSRGGLMRRVTEWRGSASHYSAPCYHLTLSPILPFRKPVPLRPPRPPPPSSLCLFSFGVLMLETITSFRATVNGAQGGSVHVKDWVSDGCCFPLVQLVMFRWHASWHEVHARAACHAAADPEDWLPFPIPRVLHCLVCTQLTKPVMRRIGPYCASHEA